MAHLNTKRYLMPHIWTRRVGVKLADDWGLRFAGRVHVDSYAAIGVAQRRGNGQLRHFRVGTLWIQELVHEGDASLVKVPGAENMADLLTQNVSVHLLDKHVSAMGFSFPAGRADSGLVL